MALDPCNICGTRDAQSHPINGDAIHQTCAACGEYTATGSLILRLRSLSPEQLLQLRGWLYDEGRSGSNAILTSANIDRIINRKVPRIEERADRLLLLLIDCIQNYSNFFNVTEHMPKARNATYSEDGDDIYLLSRCLISRGDAERGVADGITRLTPAGLTRAENLAANIGPGDIGFVAMAFMAELTEIRDNGLFKGIRDAGYIPLRVDSREHINKIDDEILASIRNAKFVVADFTGHKCGVYLEAGFAMGLGRPVFLTCKKADMKDLHFDIRQRNCIDWSDAADLAKRLQNRIEAVIGRGPEKA